MKVFLVSRGSYDDYEIRGVFGDETLADRAVAQGFGDDIEAYDVLDEIPGRVTVWTVTADLAKGLYPVPAGTQTWLTDLPDDLDRLYVGADCWSVSSLDRGKAVTAVSEAFAARRRELGVPDGP